MEYIVDHMDDFFIHVGHLPRRMPTGLSVQSVGTDPHKTMHIHRVFDTFNFSFILSGGGSFTFRGETWEVEAPCVFIQWPGEMMDYGPCGKWDTWSELSVLYPADLLNELRRRNLALERKPIWPVRRATLMHEQIRHLCELVKQPEADGMVDRIDRVCELMVVESRLGESRPPLGRDEAVIRKIRQHIREHYRERHDFDAVAREYGLSPSTFRRYWNRYVHAPPARYVMSLRIREACRLLVETDDTVAQIADELNFDDPLYFSRCFSGAMRMPATEYRRLYAVSRQTAGTTGP
jgi:AraC-like DNA-binding protein